MFYDVTIDGKSWRVEIEAAEGQWLCRVDGEAMRVDAVLVEPGVLSVRRGSRSFEIRREVLAGDLKIWVGDRSFSVEVRDPRSLRGRKRADDDHGPRRVTAPMPGKVVRLLVQVGDAVEAGAGILVVEAMKMQNEIKSPKKGIVQKILVAGGSAVSAGDALAIVE